jgi:hypothetical protein
MPHVDLLIHSARRLVTAASPGGQNGAQRCAIWG